MAQDHPCLIRSQAVAELPEVGEFPRLNKRAVFEKGKEAYIIDIDVTRPFVNESSR